MRGASKGEGLGNQFLANIRECDAVAHVLRCFEDPDVTHVEGRVDPVADAETVETELMLADLESVEKRLAGARAQAQGRRQGGRGAGRGCSRAAQGRARGGPAGPHGRRSPEEDARAWRLLQLLTAKPVLYVCNVEEAAAATGNAASEAVAKLAPAEGAGCVVISAAIEEEIAQLDDAERAEFLGGAGPARGRARPADPRGLPPARPRDLFHRRPEGGARLDDPGRRQRARRRPASSTATSSAASSAPRPSPTTTTSGSAARPAPARPGEMRSEGKAYRVQDGDVMHFLFNA